MDVGSGRKYNSLTKKDTILSGPFSPDKQVLVILRERSD